MDYLTLLNDDEKKELCELISGQYFKEEFIKNPELFQKVKKGFRAQNLSEDEALKTIIKNIDKPFVEAFINELVSKILKIIEENIEKHVSEYNENKISDQDIALVASILSSPFENNIEMYLKLNEKFDEDRNKSLCKIAEDMKLRHERNENIKNLEDENRSLNEKLSKIQSDYEQKEQDINTLKASLTEAQNEIAKLQAESAATNTIEVLSQFDDTDTSLLPVADEDQIVSLCELESDLGGKRLNRHADLDNEGYYHIFQKEEGMLPYFKNRRKIIYKNGPASDGFHGIWIWSAQPNLNDQSKDYVTSDYCKCLDAIEVYTISEASDLDGLISILKNGITFQPHSNKVIFAFAARGQYTGVLYETEKLATENDKTTFAEDCIEVPVYKFSSNDILSLNNGLSFYKKAFAGIPSELYQLKSKIEIVKDIVVKSFSWSVHKARGVNRNDYKAFKDLLETIPDDNTISDIEKACHCSNDTANKLLNEFKNTALQYINGETLEDDILRSVLSVSPELQESIKNRLRADWEKENKEQLDELRQENAEEQKVLEKARQEEKRLSDSIADKKKLAKDVEAAVDERIQEARKNAADFIAKMAFAHPVQAVIAEHAVTTEAPSRPAVTASPYQVFPASGDFKRIKVHHTWGDVLHTVATEVQNAGVAERYANGLASFLCASYIEKQPVLLAGPNAIEITQAFSAAVTDHKYGRLCCDGSYNSQAIEEIGADDEKIVLINNFIASGWMNRIPEILSRKNIFYIITHPYAEDIQVEPKSLYGFMLPLFTELFVDKKASGKYSGGYFADTFSYSVSDAAQDEAEGLSQPGLSQLGLTPLVRNRISKLLSTMHSINTDTTADEEFMFALFPIAYATLNIGKITELSQSVQISECLKDDLQSLISPLK